MKKSFFNFVLVALCFVSSFQFAQAQNNSDTSLQDGPNSTAQFLGIVDPSNTRSAGNDVCTDFYNLGSAEITLLPARPGTISGATITFTGMVKNTNPYPLVGLDIYVKIFRKQDDSLAKQNGHNLVDRFLAVKNLAIPAGASQAIIVEWVVPPDAPTGDYALATYAIVGQRYNISGLYFTDTLPASLADFTVLGEQKGIVAFDKNGVTMNSKPFLFTSPPPVFGAEEEVIIEVPVTNNTKKARSGEIKWKQYNWDGLQGEAIIDMRVSIFTLKPGETKKLSYTATKQRGVMTYVSADMYSGQILSMLDMRFARSGVRESRVDFASLSAFPLKDGKRASLYACLHGIGKETLEDGRLDLVLTDKQGKVIASEIYTGDITSSMMGITKKFTPRKNYDQVKLSVTLTRAGVVEASSTLSYDCTTIDPAQCLGESPAGVSQNNPGSKSGLLTLLLILLAVGVGGLFYYKHKQKEGVGTGIPLAALFGVLFSAALLGISPAPASAHTVPAISGPTTGASGATLTFNLTTTNAHAFYYEIDGNNDGVFETCFPGGCAATTIPAASPGSVAFTWGTPGLKTIRARTVDSIGTSLSVTHDVAISDATNITIAVTNIICPNESDLPDTANSRAPAGGIISTYAQDWLDANPLCVPSPGWRFQWGYSPAYFKGGSLTVMPPAYEGTFLGEADGSGSPGRAYTGPADDDYHTSGVSNASGVAVASVPIKNFPALGWYSDMYWVRGVMRSGYGIHADNMDGASLGDITAELHCATNNMFYDNLEGFKVTGPPDLYCVSFHYALIPDLTISVEPTLNSGTLFAGQNVTFKSTVLNVGAVIPGTFNSQFEIDIGNNGTIDTVLSPNPTLPGLGSGASAVVTSGTWSNIPLGTHRVIICADNFMVIAESSESNNCSNVGMGLFTVVQARPTVTTLLATAVTPTTATLNGEANPNGAAAAGWFRYSTANPVTCNDSFGTRVPATGFSLGSGFTTVPFPATPISGLTSGTIYYYCALASNSAGTAFGTVRSFTTLPLPDLISENLTRTGTLSSGSTLTFSGNVRNQGLVAAPVNSTARFCIDNSNCLTSSSGQIGTSPTTALAAGASSATFSHTWVATVGPHSISMCTDVTPAAVSESNEANNCTQLASFTVIQAPPTVITNATAAAATSATLNGNANPNGDAATGWFRYSLSNPVTCNDSFGTRVPAIGISLGSGFAPVNFSSAISGLTSGTTYFYCAIASNSAGTAFGTVVSFITTALPDLMISLDPTLNSGTLFAGNTVTFKGTIMNGGSIVAAGSYNNRFEIDLGNDGVGPNVTLTPHPTLSNTGPTAGAQVISGSWSNIPLGTHRVILCADNPTPAIAESSETNNCSDSAAASPVGVFTVAQTPPTVITNAAAAAATSATLNGNANPNGDAATGWFRYSLSNPVTCNDSFGTRVPAIGISLGSGFAPVNFSSAISGLTSGTTYFYCAIASNSAGIATGTVVSFITIAIPDLMIANNPAPIAGSVLVVGNTVTFRGTIMNGGGATAVGPYSNHLYIDLGNNGGEDVILTSNPASLSNTLVSGQADVSGTWTVTQGTHRVVLCADQPPFPNGVIGEPSETNNCSESFANGGTVGVFTVDTPPELTITPFSLGRDFGNVVVSTSKDMFFTVTNTGGGTLTGTMVFPAGPFTCSPSPVNVGGVCTFSLAAGVPKDIWVRFSPTATGSVSPVPIPVTSNVPTQTVQVWGAGVPAVTGNSLDFGRVLVNTNRDLVLTITNNGASPMSGTLNLPAPFTCTTSSAGMTTGLCNYNIAGGGGTNTMTIRFTPPTAQTFTGNITLSNNPALTFGLIGIGYSPKIDFKEL